MLDNRCSGLARIRMNMSNGIKLSAPSSPRKWRINPEENSALMQPIPKKLLAKYHFARIKNANKLISGSFIVINLIHF
jgi:hypothetical protein